MKLLRLTSQLVVTSLASLSLAAANPPQEIGYIEEFALAADREQALTQLIPGTEEYYYYHALHYQNTGQAEPYAEIISQWTKRFRDSATRQQIIRRQILIDHSTDPTKSLESLRRELGLTFNHQQEGKAQAKQYPSTLDPEQISWKQFLDQALKGNRNLSLLEEDAFFPLLASRRQLTSEQRRNLLSRATMPDLPNLVKVIADDLKSKESKGFGEFNIHRALTTAQLDELRGLVPDLIRNENFVHTRISRLQPGSDSDAQVDPTVRQAYLTSAWSFVKNLAPSFNSLKAHVLYQRLVFDQLQGQPDASRFLTYIKLPRNASYVRPEWRREMEQAWKHAADPNRDYSAITGLPPIVHDNPLVRSYLLHFLKDADNYDDYSPYISESWLKAIFAEAKILNGIGDPERWASLLSPAAFQALKNRVDVEFDPTNGPTNALEFGVDEPVKIRLQVKNVQKLIVKVFEINTLNYYQEFGSELSTDLQLDGLVANEEKSYEYKDAPARLVTRDFEFPQLGERRGVWVIEFIGGSRSSRAVIRKGKLEAFASIVAGGTALQIRDELHQPVANASVWLGDRQFTCDAQGRALLPFTNDPRRRSLVVQDPGGFAALASIQHSAENYQLHAGIHVVRESLRPGALGTIAVRPTLTVSGQPISLSRLTEIRLVLTSTDLDGVSTTTTIPDFKIYSDREASHEFRVPDRLASLQVQLLARISIASRSNQNIEISAVESFKLNDALRSDRVDDLYLSLIEGHYIVELLGRTGEPKEGRNLTVKLRRKGFKNLSIVTLKTDAAGRLNLGTLDGITHITAATPEGTTRNWPISKAKRTQPAVIHALAGEPLRIPYLGSLDPSELALFGFSQGGTTANHFKRLKLKDGFLILPKLAPGDYRLYLKDSHQSVTLRVASGESSGDFVFNPARSLQLNPRQPAHLTDLTANAEKVLLKIANTDDLTRVHLVATRFLPDYDIFTNLGLAPTRGLYKGYPARLPNLYLSGRRIGDEFRYILERRYGTKFPGNLLERPELLLNPWAIQDTASGVEKLAKNEAYARRQPGQAARGGAAPSPKPAPQPQEEGSPRSIDFLAVAPMELLNLRPDQDGRIEIDLKALGDRQHLHVLVTDPDGATYRSHSLADRDTLFRDLRLLKPLDPDKHFTEQDSVTLLKKGDELVIPDLQTARFESFDHVGAAYRYLLALREDPILREFSFITNWEKLQPFEKQDKYSKYACHELNFFLSRKDPAFFKQSIRPLLANKKDRTFLDDYLLDDDLDRYFSAFEYSRLNVPERILLARKQPTRLEAIRLDLRDRISLTPPDLGRENWFFDGALSSFGLTAGRKAQGTGGFRSLSRATSLPSSDMVAESALRPSKSVPALNSVRRSSDMKKMARAKVRLANESAEAMVSEEVRYKIDESEEMNDAFAADFSLAERDESALYRAIDSTKEWAENNYYKLAIEAQDYSLITENKFWLDFALYKQKNGFGSRHLGEASRSFHEAMFALALLDLPFSSPEHKTEIEGKSLEFTAGGRAIVFHREIREAQLEKNPPPLLVSQSHYRSDDRFRMENGEKIDKFVTDEFVAGVVYGSQIVVTNPTSSRQKLDVLIQIPQGSVPVSGQRATSTKRVIMEPYTTQRFEIQFYFPDTGDFSSYPAHVSKAGAVVAHSEKFSFKVVDKLSKVDETSWAFLSQWGTQEQVLDYISKENLHAIDLSKIAWRCREDKDFTTKAISALELRGMYDATLFSYAIKHDHAPAVRQFLLMQRDYLNSCGLFLESDLIKVEPIDRRAYQHLEYKPLVNNRAHRVGETRKILNQRILTQYQQLMRLLTEKAKLDNEDQLSISYYLFLQDRAEEALERLALVNPEKLPTRLQYDYFQCYAAFYRANAEAARTIADRYADHPVDRWRERFADVIAQANEIEGKSPSISDDQNRNQLQAKEAAEESTLALKVEGSEVKLSFRKLKEVQVNYYEMDLEFLFSTNPFVSSGEGGFSIVQPNKSEKLALPEDKLEHSFSLPREYQAKNVLVEVIGGGKKRSQAVFANEISTALSENFGILSVRHAKDDRPLPKVYIKVYVMTSDGAKFYKDGYTDLRGKFDYASVSTSNIANASKFSILVMSEGNGATVLEAPVPQR